MVSCPSHCHIMALVMLLFARLPQFYGRPHEDPTVPLTIFRIRLEFNFNIKNPTVRVPLVPKFNITYPSEPLSNITDLQIPNTDVRFSVAISDTNPTTSPPPLSPLSSTETGVTHKVTDAITVEPDTSTFISATIAGSPYCPCQNCESGCWDTTQAVDNNYNTTPYYP